MSNLLGTLKETIRYQMLTRLRGQAGEQGNTKRNVRPHILRLYARLNNTQNSITFDIDKKTNGDIHILSNGLDEKDAFIADSLALGIHPTIISGGVELFANTPPIFYPDPRVFPTANEARDLEILYNASLQLESNQDIRLQDVDTWQFRTVPQTQFNAVASTPPSIVQSGNEFKSLETAIAFAGGDKNSITIRWQGGSYAAIAGNGTANNNYAVIFLSGLIIKNGAQKATRGELFKLIG